MATTEPNAVNRNINSRTSFENKNLYRNGIPIILSITLSRTAVGDENMSRTAVGDCKLGSHSTAYRMSEIWFCKSWVNLVDWNIEDGSNGRCKGRRMDLLVVVLDVAAVLCFRVAGIVSCMISPCILSGILSWIVSWPSVSWHGNASATFIGSDWSAAWL
jgi:hypothetical protein